MGTVSGDPDKMLSYLGDATDQVDAWDGKVSDLELWLPVLRTALEGLPEEVNIYIPGYEESLGERVKDQEHLEEFVRNVAHGLMRANGYGFLLDGDDLPLDRDYDWPPGVLTTDESTFDPGEADRNAHLTAQAVEDAQSLQDLLDEADLQDAETDLGVILSPDDPNYHEIVRLLEQAGESMEDPAYALAFYETLGADGIELLGGIFYQMSYEAWGDIEGDGWDSMDPTEYPSRQLADPLIAGFASISGLLPEELRTELLDIEFDDRNHAVAVAIMLSGEGHTYDPEFAADAADALMLSGGGNTYYMEQAIAMRLLAENPEAAWHYASKGDDQLIELLYTPGTVDFGTERPLHTHVWVNSTPEDVNQFYELWTATTYLHATGVPIQFQDRDGNTVDLGWRDAASMAADVVPYVGTGKAWAEMTTGEDPVTGDEVNRYISAIGLIPFVGVFKSIGRGLSKLFKKKPTNLSHSVARPTDDTFPSQQRANQQAWFDYMHGRNVVPMQTPDGRIIKGYTNIHPNGYNQEMATATSTLGRHNISFDPHHPPQPGTPEFDKMIDISGGDLIFVVRADGSVMLAPRSVDGVTLNHGPLNYGPNDPILAAGEIKITGSDGSYRAWDIDNRSGHFVPDQSSIYEVGIPDFQHQYGIRVESISSELYGPS